MAHGRKGLGALVLTAVMAALAVAWPAALASAEDAAPAPCNDVLLADPAKDEVVLTAPPTVFREGEDSYLDITKVFFNYRAGADGKLVLTGNIQVRDLKPTVPVESPEGSTTYWIEFDRVANVDWLRAKYKGGAWTFDFGEVTPVDIPSVGYQSLPTATTGRVFPGPNGVVSIDFPDIPEIKAGAKLDGVWALTDVVSETYDTALSFYNGRSDDTDVGAAKTYTVKECPAGPAAPAEPTVTPPVDNQPPATPPPADNTPPGNQPPAQQPQQNRLAVLPFKAAASLGSAKKAVKKKAFSVKVASTRDIRNLVVQLKQGSKVIATGKLASLNGNGTLKLALKSKKLKKGKYLLAASGMVDGQQLFASQTVKLAK
jgi:hypothetical protein